MHDRPAVWGIVAANAVTLAVALWQQWPMVLMLWPYWVQNLVIGWYARQRILALTKFSTEGFKMGSQPVEPTEAGKHMVALFFLIHYGFFHLGYLVFLLVFSFGGFAGRAPTGQDGLLIAGLSVGFWLSHRASHRLNVAADTQGERNIGTMMVLPYARVLPMHLTIILGMTFGGGAWALLLFTVLKTAADVVMHMAEHRFLQNKKFPLPTK